MPPGATRVVNAVRDLFRARFMRDFCEVMPDLSRDVVVGARLFEDLFVGGAIG
jgi:hypothetical protein